MSSKTPRAFSGSVPRLWPWTAADKAAALNNSLKVDTSVSTSLKWVPSRPLWALNADVMFVNHSEW